jgi:hypothetical protein
VLQPQWGDLSYPCSISYRSQKVKSYQCYGLNVQTTCDASCHFPSLSVLFPGGTSNSKAFYAPQVYSLVEELPGGYFVVADNLFSL